MLKWITKNFAFKILCLILATVSWHAIHQTISYKNTIRDIPVQIETAEGWAMSDISPNTVDVTFRGAHEDIRMIDPRLVQIVLDLTNKKELGNITKEINPDDVTGIRHVSVVAIEPNAVTAKLDHDVQKEVVVKARTAGTPLYGKVNEIVCSPSVVTIHGPAQQLKHIQQIYTKPIDIHMKFHHFVDQIEVIPPPGSGIHSIKPEKVKVSINITEEVKVKTLSNVAVSALINRNNSIKVNITPAILDVKIKGRPEIMEKIAGKIPKVFVDCSQLDPSLTYDLPVNIYFPECNEVAATAEPAFVHVTINSE
jgi:YbbR domain-containing protein